jgi:hypothetical protein
MVVAKQASTPRSTWFDVVVTVTAVSGRVTFNLATSSEVIDK